MPEPSPNRGVMIVLAYLWPLALIPLLIDKQDTEVQWHARHGIVLAIAELILLFAYIVVTSLVGLRTLGLGCVLTLFLIFLDRGARRARRGDRQRHQRRAPDRSGAQCLREPSLASPRRRFSSPSYRSDR